MGAIFPNQNTIIIKKTPVQKNFLQIDIDEWEQAAKDFHKSFNTFKIYLYLAGNEINYNLGLSPEVIEKELGIKKSSYYQAIDALVQKGYLVNIGKNKLEFYTKPHFSATMENSTQVENEEKTTNSAQTENSTLMEEKVKEVNLVLKNSNSATMENSAATESLIERLGF